MSVLLDMQLYRFSPIQDEDTYLKALQYIDVNLRELSKLVIDESLPINTLKIFAHYKDEHTFLKKWIDSLGQNEDEVSSTSYYVKPLEKMSVNDDQIEYVGIRKPDPYRAQVGCGDYVVNNFEQFKENYLSKSEYIRKVKHPKYEMLELFHPDIDVLGYIVKE